MPQEDVTVIDDRLRRQNRRTALILLGVAAVVYGLFILYSVTHAHP